MGATDGEEDTGRGPSLPFAPPSARELAEARGSRMPGGLAPFPGAQPLAAFQLPIVLERLERALEKERDWYATGVRVDYLPFYSRFYLGEVTDPGRHPSRELYAMNGNDIRPFHGGPRAILALNREAGLLSSGSAMAHYLQFFLHFSRGRTPPVRLVQSLEELRHWTGANEEVLASCRELVVKAECAPVEGEGAGVAVTGTAVAGADLCRLRAVILPDGSPVELHLEPLREGVGAETAVVPAVAGDPGMAPIHGPWDVVPDVDRQDLLSYLTPGEREGMDAGAPLLRRTLSCYPGVDLVRLPPQDPGEEPVMLFWAGGIPLRITFRERPALNARFLAIGDPVTAEACLRLYTWLRRGPDYPITILDRPSDLDALLAADAGPGERGHALEDRWVPFRCESEGGDAYRAHFVLLEENKLLAMDILLGGDGEVRQASETEIVDGLPVDPERLARCLTLPPFGACP